MEKLWEITEELNILYRDNWTALVDREMVKFQKELLLSGEYTYFYHFGSAAVSRKRRVKCRISTFEI